jgi:transposase-like protein
MPWKERTTMSLREEFVKAAIQENSNISKLCREYGISRKTGYKWIKRYREGGKKALADRLRRPHYSPNKPSSEIENAILEVRQEQSS